MYGTITLTTWLFQLPFGPCSSGARPAAIERRSTLAQESVRMWAFGIEAFFASCMAEYAKQGDMYQGLGILDLGLVVSILIGGF